jgi:hypothetical protein
MYLYVHIFECVYIYKCIYENVYKFTHIQINAYMSLNIKYYSSCSQAIFSHFERMYTSDHF